MKSFAGSLSRPGPRRGECEGREPTRDARPPTRSTEPLFLDLLAIRVVIQTA
jgi:hypothetical protein